VLTVTLAAIVYKTYTITISDEYYYIYY